MLTTANIDPTVLGDWIQTAAWLGGAVLTVILIIRNWRHRNEAPPQPFIVRAEETYATKEQLRELREERERAVAKLEQDMRTQMENRFTAAAQSRKELHAKNDALGRDLAGLTAENASQTKRIDGLVLSVNGIDGKLDRLLNHLLTTKPHDYR